MRENTDTTIKKRIETKSKEETGKHRDNRS